MNCELKTFPKIVRGKNGWLFQETTCSCNVVDRYVASKRAAESRYLKVLQAKGFLRFVEKGKQHLT